MRITGHKSIQGVRAYKEVNKEQHLAAMNTLINAINPSEPSILDDSANGSPNIVDITTKISSDEHSVARSDSIVNTTPEFSSNDNDRKFPIFNNVILII